MTPATSHLAIALLIALAGCSPAPDGSDTATSVERSVTSAASASPSEPGGSFPTARFADISEDPVSEEMAAGFEEALREMAGGGGMAATVMSPDGTWSGAVGKADGVRDVSIHDQFAIASATKSIVAAQVMQMVEAGELELDDPADDHLPPHLEFDTNGATSRQLLGHRSGIPDYTPEVWESFSTERQRVWSLTELLDMVPADRAPPGDHFEYGGSTYLLLGLVIEHVRGRPVADVLRDGVLDIEGTERLIYQPDERPTEPMAMPNGESIAALRTGRGYLPSIAGATATGPQGSMASDVPSLARWWRAFCAGEIVSRASLTEMSRSDDGDWYGLGLNVGSYPEAVGHPGQHFGYAAWAGCLPEHGSVVVVLSNRVPEDFSRMPIPLLREAIASRSD